MSYDYIYGIARPDGFNQPLFDYRNYPEDSGFNFSDEGLYPFDDMMTDIFFENFEGVFYVNVWADDSIPEGQLPEIQDMGPTNSIYDISHAPTGGWVPVIGSDQVKYVEAKVGHTFIVKTMDGNFAKFRISLITSQKMKFDWAYQMISGELMLKRAKRELERKNMNAENIAPSK